MQSIKTKVLTVFMSVIMVVSMFPALGSAAASQSGNCGAQGTNVKFNLTNDGTMTISGTGAMADFTYDAKANYTNIPWYSNRTSIKKVIIKDGVTHIGSFSFVWCSQIKEIVWPTSGCVKSIGKAAFYECNGLPTIQIPYGVISVGYQAYAYCRSATTISLPNTLKTIAYGAFANCDLRTVYLPASVTTIGHFGFRGNYKMTKFSGGAGLITIGTQAFEHCWKLSYFAITSKKLKKIGKACFLCCSNLKTIYIKKTTKLTKKGVKNSMYLSSVKKVKVKKSKVKKYKKYFTYRNCAKRGVKVKK